MLRWLGCVIAATFVMAHAGDLRAQSSPDAKTNANAVDYLRDVEPILRRRCYSCHGPRKKESGLRLDQKAALLAGGDTGEPTVQAGRPDQSLLIQVVTGLFANDDIITEGPLYMWVSKPVSDWLTRVHRINRFLVVALVATHLSAVLFYLWGKGENLIKPMITGKKSWHGGHSPPPAAPAWLAGAIFAITGLSLYLIIY